VTLISFETGGEPPEAREAVRRWCASIETVELSSRRSWLQAWAGLFSSLPSQVAYYRSTRMQDRVREILAAQRFDAIFVQLFRMAPFVSGIDHPCKLLFLADSMALNLARGEAYSPWWQRQGMRWERRRVASYELRAAQDFREAWVASEVDREDLRRRGCTNVLAVPHGVDESLFNVNPLRCEEPRVLFIGNLSVPHNVDAAVFAARSVFPMILKRVPSAHLWLVGADPSARVLELARLKGVHVTGHVNDLIPIWSTARVMLAPLRFSSGIQNKVLEAMAAGVPVVTTPPVAEAMNAADGEMLRIGADSAALAEIAAQLILHPSDGAPMTSRARSYVRDHFTWDLLARRIEDAAGETSDTE